MSLKELHAPHLGRAVKMGRRPPKPGGLRLSFARYAGVPLPAPPSTCSYSDKALPVLVDIMGNDELGDCVCACFGHLAGVATGNAGDLFHATLDQVVSMYSAIGGYVPGDPSTDQGCDEQVGLKYLKTTGFPNGTKALGYLAVNPNNTIEVMQAM